MEILVHLFKEGNFIVANIPAIDGGTCCEINDDIAAWVVDYMDGFHIDVTVKTFSENLIMITGNTEKLQTLINQRNGNKEND